MMTESRQEVRLLQWVTSEINTGLDLDRTLATVLEAMDELFGFRHSLVLLVDETGEGLTVAACHGYDTSSVGARVLLGQGPIGVAAKRRRVVRVANLGQQRAYLSTVRARMERAGRGEELETAPVLPGLPDAESQIAIPLSIKETLIGVFFVETPERRVFGEREESLVSIVANHAAASIHNARLYQSLKELAGTLEQRVRERTEELERKNRELRETQAQLLQSAKMAALGDLVAGVAHDMNTPLGAIYANADLSERAVSLVKEAFRGEGATSGPWQPRLGKALDALDDSAKTTRVASERILGILKSLRQFARLDESERKRANLHEGLDAALELLHHRLTHVAVIRDYGDLPEMICFPNRLNQLFMNLLVNAIEAMEADAETEATLSIRTRREGQEAIVEVADSGCGMTEETAARIFDPGFTTKGVGVGLGLGLSIGYRVAEDHGGRIEVESLPGKGSRFIVRLPLREGAAAGTIP
jgi:signal transduction histidine kinase